MLMNVRFLIMADVTLMLDVSTMLDRITVSVNQGMYNNTTAIPFSFCHGKNEHTGTIIIVVERVSTPT